MLLNQLTLTGVKHVQSHKDMYMWHVKIETIQYFVYGFDSSATSQVSICLEITLSYETNTLCYKTKSGYKVSLMLTWRFWNIV